MLASFAFTFASMVVRFSLFSITFSASKIISASIISTSSSMAVIFALFSLIVNVFSS